MTAFLVAGPEGHILIDGGHPRTASQIIDSIDELGFDIADVKILLNSHGHFDHAGGLRALQDASGAALWVSEGDAAVIAVGGRGDRSLSLFRPLWFTRYDAPRIDRQFQDGETVQLGPLSLTAHVTAGHSQGCTSWAIPVQDGDRALLAVSICSLTLLPCVSVAEPETYPGIRGDFEHSFEALRALPADIFLASHASWFELERKRREQVEAAGSVEPFIDRDGYTRYINDAEARFQKRLSRR